MTVIEDNTEVRDVVPINPGELYVVGLDGAARYITATTGLPLDATDLAAFADIGAGPPVERMVDGALIFAKRTLDCWTMCEYGDHDGTEFGKRVMVDNYLHGDGGGEYWPIYDPDSGKVGLEWRPQWIPSEEETARMNAERDAADPIID